MALYVGEHIAVVVSKLTPFYIARHKVNKLRHNVISMISYPEIASNILDNCH